MADELIEALRAGDLGLSRTTRVRFAKRQVLAFYPAVELLVEQGADLNPAWRVTALCTT